MCKVNTQIKFDIIDKEMRQTVERLTAAADEHGITPNVLIRDFAEMFKVMADITTGAVFEVVPDDEGDTDVNV